MPGDEGFLIIVCYCSRSDPAGMLIMVISVLMNYFKWYLCRTNNVNILRCSHVENDSVSVFNTF